jgi:site-specific DNA-methyltransferase (adenine-specific)
MITILHGDCRERLKEIDSRSVRCCITSPPYWLVRNYGSDIGMEKNSEKYIWKLVLVFREVKRILKDRGTLWLNLGDVYNRHVTRQLECIPWRVVLALKKDGWFVRSDIIWHKTNMSPEFVNDRPVRDHEYIFLLSKNRYYDYYKDAIAEKTIPYKTFSYRQKNNKVSNVFDDNKRVANNHKEIIKDTRNIRTVWRMSTAMIHYRIKVSAIFPDKLVKRCILASTKPGELVLDPFAGIGTTGRVAIENDRQAIMIEQNVKLVEWMNKHLSLINNVII